MVWSKVVFPAPLGPMRERISPSRIWREGNVQNKSPSPLHLIFFPSKIIVKLFTACFLHCNIKGFGINFEIFNLQFSMLQFALVLSWSLPLLNLREDQIDDISQQEKNNAQGNGYVEISPTRLHYRCSSQHTGITLDIPAYHDGSSYF